MFNNELSITPTSSGCYLMKDINNTIIYVGKAKNLKKRLSSYFNRPQTGKTYNLINNIHHFEYIVTKNEKEALLLEISLIQKHNPKYNILLKDDKSYPFILLTKEKYPILSVVRNIKNKKNKKLFGPYPSSYSAKKVVELLNRIYQLRKCNKLGKDYCLYYHLNQCLGYCKNKIDSEIIKDMTIKITNFLNGNYNEVIKKIESDLKASIDSLNFEKSIELKEMLEYINNILNKQTIEFIDNVNRDVFGYSIFNGYICIQVFYIRGGKIVERNSKIIPLNNEIEDVLEEYIVRFYEDNIIPKEILLPTVLEDSLELLKEVINTNIFVPKKGNKKNIVDLVSENALVSLNEKFDIMKKDEEKTIEANNKLGTILGINDLNRIDIFDISNIFGDFNVGGMVVFLRGNPHKKEYRKFKISNNKNDDYNSMKEVIYRRYFRAIKEKSELPQLLLVDGGKNQISAASEVINSLNLNIKICGLIKNEKHRTNDLIDEFSNVIDIEKDSNIFNLLTRIQDEVHNYTINYHRNIRSKGLISSVLDGIEGLGDKRKKILIKKYKNIDNIKNLNIEELSKTIPKGVATNIYNYFNKEEQ